MSRLIAICATATMLLAVTACNPPGTHDADVKAIQDNEAQWNQDYAFRDLNKLVAHYSDDAVLMAPGMPVSSGRAAIQSMLQQMISDPALALQFHVSKVDVAKSGDLGYTQGTYNLTATDPQSKQVFHDHGSYVTTYRKQADGSWKAIADIASSEVPMPPAPPTRP